ncbi:Abi family protein [Pseudomonas sp. T1.Ur]|uniref:Abi family protein n=1 Tax=Pseudomonas sp. T1.Ur TaxID=2928704 RepID=UPI0024C1138B|nr:Abi family protein [Pseudomonas sp. T1.Ur]
MYVFDKKLRLLTLDALERIEIALRVDISHGLGRHEKFAYLKPELFHESFSTQLDGQTGLTKHHAWIGKHAALINRSKEDFIRHNKEKIRPSPRRLGGVRSLGLRCVIDPLCGHDRNRSRCHISRVRHQ